VIEKSPATVTSADPAAVPSTATLSEAGKYSLLLSRGLLLLMQVVASAPSNAARARNACG
jgi:hypothetical protein|tara:strand:- start:3971 stop:4150 length:180 start_codon:yes stop_codon:yes gene_type:complete